MKYSDNKSENAKKNKMNGEYLSERVIFELKHGLNNTKIFNDIPPSETDHLLGLIGAGFYNVKKGGYLYKCCENSDDVTLLISGILCGVQLDDAGGKSIIQVYRPPEILGLPLAFGFDALYMDVVASIDAVVMTFPYVNLRVLIESDSIYARQLFWNISAIQADSLVAMKTRISVLSKKNTREKILYYLKKEAQYNDRLDFKIPLSRQELADYLFVDRTALSHQLSILKKEGYLNYNQNEFQLAPEFFADFIY